eukprot:Em0024g300a
MRMQDMRSNSLNEQHRDGFEWRGIAVPRASWCREEAGRPRWAASLAGMLVQPACSNTAVTHVNNTLKNNVQLTWTAPPAGTGNVVFSYAVVVQNSGGVNEYYATLTSPAIAELGGAGGQACPVAPKLHRLSDSGWCYWGFSPCRDLRHFER